MYNLRSCLLDIPLKTRLRNADKMLGRLSEILVGGGGVLAVKVCFCGKRKESYMTDGHTWLPRTTGLLPPSFSDVQGRDSELLTASPWGRAWKSTIAPQEHLQWVNISYISFSSSPNGKLHRRLVEPSSDAAQTAEQRNKRQNRITVADEGMWNVT